MEIKIEDLSLNELKENVAILGEKVGQRLKVENNTNVTVEYRHETRRLQGYFSEIYKEIDIRYDELYGLNDNKFEFMEHIVEREESKEVVGDDGEILIEKFKTNIPPIDDHLIDGGFLYGSLCALAGESNTGKSDIMYMLIASAIKQNMKVHLHSYELGYSSLNQNFNSSHKNKLRVDFKENINKGLFSIDTRAQELQNIKTMINWRADEGCRIFMLDSLTKIKINGVMVLDGTVIDVMEELRILATERNLIIFIIGQKDKNSKVNNSNEMYGSVMQMHYLDYMFFVSYENLEDKMTSEREIVMVKNRGQDTKKSIITDFDLENHNLFYIRDGGSLGSKIEENNKKIKQWSSQIK